MVMLTTTVLLGLGACVLISRPYNLNVGKVSTYAGMGKGKERLSLQLDFN